MMRALTFAAGVAVGFVVGTRTGRQGYEKMRDQSLELWHNPAVQEKVSSATHVVKEKAPEVQHKVEELAKKATHHGSAAHSDAGTAAAQNGAVPVPPASPDGRHTLDQG
ncbi:YtxH domain-containing protein [Rhodococcus sp. NPDC056960]|uniref:YtxH domain-containing protein n=1 Tax=Rhodococcus sp. NPDC056960 TaxID=3345982 RepID=UPI003640D335